MDSALCHTPSVVYNFSDQNVDDVYLFVKNGLTPVMSSMNDICKFIEGYENYTINEKAVKFYNYAYNTPYESKIAKLISDLIKAICEDQEQAFIKNVGFPLIIQLAFIMFIRTNRKNILISELGKANQIGYHHAVCLSHTPTTFEW